MDTLTFVAEVVKALAWPTIVLIVAVIVRTPLRQLLPLLAKLKYRDFEIDFSRRLDEVAAQIPSGTAATSSNEEDALVRRANVAPRTAVLEAWEMVEQAARAQAAVRGISHVGPQFRIGPALQQAGLDPWQVAAVSDLQSLRNSVAHSSSFDPDPEAAKQYVRLAAELQQSLGPK